MRETRNAQATLFDHYAKHEFGRPLEKLSELLDDYPQILDLVAGDFDKANVASTGACGLSIESILRCLVLKQTTQLSYHKLAFHLCDSPTYRTFARLRAGGPVAQQVGPASHRVTHPAGHAVANPQAVDVGLVGSR